MPRPVQLHVMFSADEMSAEKALAGTLGTTASDTIRILILTGTPRPTAVESATLALDLQTLARYIGNIRALGHLLNQSTHSLSAIAKVVRESGADALDPTEAMEGVDKRVLCAVGKFFQMWARFVARIILLFWHYGSCVKAGLRALED